MEIELVMVKDLAFKPGRECKSGFLRTDDGRIAHKVQDSIHFLDTTTYSDTGNSPSMFIELKGDFVIKVTGA